MAEVVLKVGTFGMYEDGDILCAWNDKYIKKKNAETICRESGDRALQEIYAQKTHIYRFDRISEFTVTRTNLVTDEIDIFSDDRDDLGRYMHVKWHIQINAKKMFGFEGAERWYEKETIPDDTKLDLIWDEIEARTGERRANNTLYPLGDNNLMEFLALSVDDMTDAQAANLVLSEYETQTIDGEEREVQVKKRINKIDYASISAISADTLNRIYDRKEIVDVRGDTKINPISEVVALKV